jgi:cytochrome c-type biogenesis protein CcmH
VLLWVLIASLTGAAILAVLVPLSRAPAADSSAQHAARVYRDQLAELERDKAEGRISTNEAEAARAEIARRLIAADAEAKETPARSERSMPRRAVALVALIGIPALSLSLYLGLGSPSLPGLPLAARLSAPAAPDDIETLVAKVEEHLAEAPEDGRGWDVIAPVYLRLGRAEDSARAYANAIRILGSTAARQNGLGEALLVAEGGVVTEDARKAFETARALDPKAPGPRYYIALAAEQEGKRDEALKEMNALLAEAPADAPWRPLVVQSLARLDPNAAPPASVAGPTGEQVAAAADMSDSDRSAMIDSMVTRLATRLKEEPNDVDGWLQLIRSYVVLGRGEDAAEAARAALAGVEDANARGRVEALIADLGVTPAGAGTQ